MQTVSNACFIDTNILVYLMDENEPEKRAKTISIIEFLSKNHMAVISLQSISEFYAVLTRRFPEKSKEQHQTAAHALFPWCTAPLNMDCLEAAWEIQNKTRFNWFDCLLLASATKAMCRFFLSEDLQHQQTIKNLTILNPFRTSLEEIKMMTLN